MRKFWGIVKEIWRILCRPPGWRLVPPPPPFPVCSNYVILSREEAHIIVGTLFLLPEHMRGVALEVIKRALGR